jgi:pimeloyl-ACP methyl ester carboxylesterase
LQRVSENVRGGLIPNSGHWVTEEQPEFVADELRRFFLE